MVYYDIYLKIYTLASGFGQAALDALVMSGTGRAALLCPDSLPPIEVVASAEGQNLW